MGVADKITRLTTARNNIRTALAAKGITAASGHGFEDFAEDISDITSGGSGESTSVSGLNLKIKIINHINPETGLWERPAGWPDITSLANNIDYENNEQCAYFTYDLSKFSKPWIGLYVRNPSTNSIWYLDRGHISNGVFVVDESFSNRSGTVFRQVLDISNGEIQLWRLTSDAHIASYGFATNTTTSASNFTNTYQPCVERSGNLPWITSIYGSTSTSSTSYNNTTIWLEQDSLAIGNNSNITSLSSAWSNCYSLQSLDLSNWNTTNWAVINFSQTWYNCYSLQSLDLSNWNTTNWQVTNLSNTWYGCYSLQSLNISNWNTTNWAVTSLLSTWAYCYSLQSLDLSNWNTTNWAVINFSQTWYNCYSLQSLDLSNWNTTNWAVTNLQNTWYYCYNLQSLDLSNWDTTNWAVTNLSNTWATCYNLRSLKGPEQWTWVTSKTFNTLPTSAYFLSEFNGLPYSVNHSYSQLISLTITSLVNILTGLPTITTSKTITLGQTNKLKLTAEQIAIATQKGWTVA